MEDRYLYKAKTTPKEKGEFNNVWVTGNLIVSNGKYYIHPVGNVVNVKNNIGRIIVMHEVIPDTICRCTGLKDKNGNLIWENDIIAYRDCTEEKYVIAWELDKACFEYQQYSCSIMNFDELSSCEVEVIGNIFDNPELLESEG
jgi:uncharacterized phage protein (TIGR01671 family)